MNGKWEVVNRYPLIVGTCVSAGKALILFYCLIQNAPTFGSR